MPFSEEQKNEWKTLRKKKELNEAEMEKFKTLQNSVDKRLKKLKKKERKGKLTQETGVEFAFLQKYNQTAMPTLSPSKKRKQVQVNFEDSEASSSSEDEERASKRNKKNKNKNEKKVHYETDIREHKSKDEEDDIPIMIQASQQETEIELELSSEEEPEDNCERFKNFIDEFFDRKWMKNQDFVVTENKSNPDKPVKVLRYRIYNEDSKRWEQKDKAFPVSDRTLEKLGKNKHWLEQLEKSQKNLFKMKDTITRQLEKAVNIYDKHKEIYEETGEQEITDAQTLLEAIERIKKEKGIKSPVKSPLKVTRKATTKFSSDVEIFWTRDDTYQYWNTFSDELELLRNQKEEKKAVAHFFGYYAYVKSAHKPSTHRTYITSYKTLWKKFRFTTFDDLIDPAVKMKDTSTSRYVTFHSSFMKYWAKQDSFLAGLKDQGVTRSLR